MIREQGFKVTDAKVLWDGGIMNNTPLTQLVRLHRQYWLKVKGLRDTVPKLEIGVVNVHPVKEDTIMMVLLTEIVT